MAARYAALPVGAEFEEFYEHYKGLVHALVSRACFQANRYDELEDIKQTIWIKVWRAYPGLDMTQAHNCWITIVVQHTLTDFFRKEQRKNQFFVPWDEELVSLTVTDQVCNEKLLLIEAAAEYESVYHSLKNEERLVIDMLIEGYKQVEIARALGLTKQTVRHAIVRAQRPFRQRAGLPPNTLRRRKTGV